MGTGTISGIVLYAGCGACALEAVAGYARLARAKDGHRDAGSWHAPLIFSAAAFALAGGAGILSPLAATLLAVVPLAVVTAIVWRAWRAATQTLGPAKATALVLRGLLGRVREALWRSREDFRDLRGRLNRDDAGGDPAAPAPAAYARGTAPPAVAALRTVPVPSVHADPNLGAAPVPAEIAAALETAGAPVPPEWQAVADLAGEFEPADQDELEDHMAGEMAGIMAWADGIAARAETFLTVRGLHPAYVAACIDFADEVADLASTHVMNGRRYHDVYGDIEEWTDREGDLPDDARGWFGGGGAPAA